MTEAEWRESRDLEAMIEFLRGRASDRKFRLFAVACCRTSRQLLRNRDLARGLDSAEAFADGQLSAARMRVVAKQCNGIAVGLYGPADTERLIRRWAEATAVANATCVVGEHLDMAHYAWDAVWNLTRAAHRDPATSFSQLARCVFGNPFRPVSLDPAWRAEAVVGFATGIYADRVFDRLPVLADALEDAGCADADVLGHCRGPGPHVRGCWVVDLLRGKT